MGDMPISPESVAHIRLTVCDIDRSRAFYERVFGWPVVDGVPPEFLHGGVLYRMDHGMLGLRPAATDRFDENRVGLDHLAFRVASLAELQAAAAHLDDCGVAHEPIKDIGVSYILEFRDPDNIALELVAAK